MSAPLACPNTSALINISNSKNGVLYKVYDALTGGSLITTATGNGGNVSINVGIYQQSTNLYIETVDGTCVSVSRVLAAITVRETMINYPDLRIQACAGGGNINLSKYIDTVDIVSITWADKSVGAAPVTVAGVVNSNNFTFPGTYVYKYKISSHCSPADVERLLYAMVINDNPIGLPPDTVVVCKDFADHLNLNQILGIEAGGTWRTVPISAGINAFIKQSPPTSPYAGAVVFDGKGAYSLLTNINYHGVASKKIEFYYKSAAGCCLGGKEYKIVIILTSDITV